MGKRDEVLQIASEYFLGHGYQGASINAMARDSGVSKESIYRYFHGKEDLFKAVIDYELTLYKKSLEEATEYAAHHDLGEALSEIATQMVRTLTSDRTLALRRLIFQETRKSPQVGKHYFSIGPGPAYGRIEALFRNNSERTAFAPRELSRYFVGMLLHPLFLERECGLRKMPRQADAHKYAERVVGDFLRAFFPP